MNFTKRVELDNLFSRMDLGDVQPENPDEPGIYKTDDHDYITIRVPYSYRDRFQSFWESARKMLDDYLQVYHVQHGTPIFDDIYIDETWYFISVSSAKEVLDWFYEILPDKLPESLQ